MADDFVPGLEGVIAFETEIAEPDKDGGALRYRGVDIEELVGHVPFEKVWGLLVDGSFDPGLPPAEPWPLTVRSGNPPVDVQSALATLAPAWGMERPLMVSGILVLALVGAIGYALALWTFRRRDVPAPL